MYIEDGLYTGANNQNININKDITVQGENVNSTTIDAQDNGRIFIVHTGVCFTAHNLAFVNGVADQGGAIYSTGNLNIDDCKFTSNSHNRWRCN